jgi:hypothetical protein
LFVFPILTKERAERHLRNGLEIYETNVPMLSSEDLRSGCSCKDGNAPQVCTGRSYRRPLHQRRLSSACTTARPGSGSAVRSIKGGQQCAGAFRAVT